MFSSLKDFLLVKLNKSPPVSLNHTQTIIVELSPHSSKSMSVSDSTRVKGITEKKYKGKENRWYSQLLLPDSLVF